LRIRQLEATAAEKQHEDNMQRYFAHIPVHKMIPQRGETST
jgi:hypothetical protein